MLSFIKNTYFCLFLLQTELSTKKIAFSAGYYYNCAVTEFYLFEGVVGEFPKLMLSMEMNEVSLRHKEHNARLVHEQCVHDVRCKH